MSFNFSKYTHQTTPSLEFFIFYFLFFIYTQSRLKSSFKDFFYIIFFFCSLSNATPNMYNVHFFSSIENLDFFLSSMVLTKIKSKKFQSFFFKKKNKKTNPNLDWGFFKNYLKFSQKVMDLRK